MVLVEPYYGGSHRAWADGIVAHSRHHVTLVTHAGGFWKWRMQGAALTLADALAAHVATHGRPDLLVVSAMVHLPALLGLARRSVAGVPVVLYLHENQLTYPLPAGERGDQTYAMTNWLSLAAADRVVANSRFHASDLLAALPRFLGQFPDHRHGPDHVEAVAGRTRVLPVGIDPALLVRPAARDGGPPLVLWNHRWEYDKAPEEFFAALDEVAAAGVDFRVAVAGERFQTVPPVFEAARARLGPRVVHFGTADRPRYEELLARAEVVVSTARHEFFGVAVLEAIAAGALPVLPDRLAYPELVPAATPYLYDGPAGLVARLRWALTDHAGRSEAAATARAFAARFAWPEVAARYDELFVDVVAG